MYLPFQVMYRTQRNKLFDSYLYTRRSSYFVNTVSRKKTRQLIKGIKKGVPTWYAPDQDFRRERNVFAPFMGIATATITAGSRLAQSSGAAMLPYYPERKKTEQAIFFTSTRRWKTSRVVMTSRMPALSTSRSKNMCASFLKTTCGPTSGSKPVHRAKRLFTHE